VHVVNYSLFSIAHGYSCFAQLTAESSYTLQCALKRNYCEI